MTDPTVYLGSSLAQTRPAPASVLAFLTAAAERYGWPKLKPDKRVLKAEYDRKRRAELGETLRAQKMAAYYADHERQKAIHAEYRNRPENVARHNAYCRRPAYVAAKTQYDRRRRARLQFDQFADSFLLLQDLEREIDTRASRYDIYLSNGTINKAQTRRRALA